MKNIFFTVLPSLLADVNLACGLHNTDRGRPIQGVSDMDSRLPPTLPNMLSVSSMEYLGSDQEPLPPREYTRDVTDRFHYLELSKVHYINLLITVI